MGHSLSIGDSGTHTSYSVVLAVSLVVIVFGFVYFYNLDGWLINDDEGSFLYQAWRISEGERPYQDMLTSRWPLFLYVSAGWMRVVGVNVTLMRVLPVCLTLGTAVLVFLVARTTLPAKAALLGMVIFLFHPDVMRFGRSFQPEPFYVFFSVLGLYLVARAYKTNRLACMAGGGLVFAVASLHKLLAALVAGGVGLFMVITLLRKHGLRRRSALQMLVFLLAYGIPFALATLGFVLFVPRFSANVIGVNLAQGQELTLFQVVAKGLIFLLQYFLVFAPLLMLAFPSAWRGWRGDMGTALFSWQLPTALAFLILSRELFPRLLIYLVPSLAILFAATLEPIRLLGRSMLLLAVVCAVIIPWTVTDAQLILRSEQDTMAVARYIDERVPPGAYVLSDYQELNFYACRPSTYSGAEISYVVVAGGQITGRQLMAEIEDKDVAMVLIDVSPLTASHMVALWDYEEFRTYLGEHFVLADVLPRYGQQLEVYVKRLDP